MSASPFIIGPAEIDRRFDYHAPSGMAKDFHQALRQSAKAFALALTNLPDGREKALAFTTLEESTFWAHAAIAREPSLHEPVPVVEAVVEEQVQ